jgi:molybdopterin/thiamine biosynthesis adenylyltransferase/rhodanese-related sulfurtransferase
MLNTEELQRYNRHIILSEVKLKGQEQLKSAKVLVIGAGGLGCPVFQYLTAAGVGTLGVIDDDKIELSNLQRQILFRTDDVGKFKAEVAAQTMQSLNPFTDFVVFKERLTNKNVIDIFSQFDIIVDGTDNFETRYLINDACVELDKPFVFGSIFKFDGQISVFNYQSGPTYRCLFPEPPAVMPNCSQVGVMGVLPGIIGAYQANETLKIILGIGDVLQGKLLTIDTLHNVHYLISFKKDEGNDKVKVLDDYSIYENDSCPITMVETISVDELAEQIDDVFLLDVREEYEYEICHLANSLLLPLAELKNGVAEIPRDKKVVVYCHHGSRSEDAVTLLSSEYGFKNLVSLDGGIDEWAEEIDNDVERY